MRVGLLLCLVACLCTDAKLHGISSASTWVCYYGYSFSSSTMDELSQFDIVVIRVDGANPAVVAELQRRGVLYVLGYITVGEEEPQYPALPGTGGPSYWDFETDTIAGTPGGDIASFYVDGMWDADKREYVVDGVADANPIFKGRYIYPNEEWRTVLHHQREGPQEAPYEHLGYRAPGMAQLVGPRQSDYDEDRTHDWGFDGVFMDTLDTSGPWEQVTGYYPWTAQAMSETIFYLRDNFPDAVLLANRGSFFHNPTAYSPSFNIRPYDYSFRHAIDLQLYESYFLDSDEATRGQSPYWDINRNNYAPKLCAEANRADGFYVLALDYACDRDDALLARAARESQEAGWLAYLAPNGHLGTVGMYTINTRTPLDVAPPKWDSTASTFTEEVPQRVGVQRVMAGGPGEAIVQWDVAMDQTDPVAYDVHYKRSTWTDWAVARSVSFTTGDGWSQDVVTNFANQYTLEGLFPGSYSFRVTATDGWGFRENNNVTLTSIVSSPPAHSDVAGIVVDGDPSEWDDGCLVMEDGVDDHLSLDLRALYLAHHGQYLYGLEVYGEQVVLTWRNNLLFDVDSSASTGFRSSSMAIGGDYLMQGTTLFRFQGLQQQDWVWVKVSDISRVSSGKVIEWSVPLWEIGVPSANIKIAVWGQGEEGNDWMPDSSSFPEIRYTIVPGISCAKWDTSSSGGEEECSGVADGDLCVTTCPSGQYAEPSFRVCSSGEWSSVVVSACLAEPPCLPPVLAHGGVTPARSIFSYGEQATLTCSSGYSYHGINTSTCVGGSFDTPPGLCIPLECATRPPPVEHATDEHGTTCSPPMPAGSVCRVQCDPDYCATSEAICEHGEWTMPTCEPITCSEASVGALSRTCDTNMTGGDTYPSGVTCSFSCPEGQMYQGTPRTCISKNTWSGYAGFCVSSTLPAWLPAGSVSSYVPVGAITVDGNISDWRNLVWLGMDAEGGAGDVDYLRLYAAHSDEKFFLVTETTARTDISLDAFLLDTDMNEDTGYRGPASLPLGAEYLIEGAAMFEFVGSDQEAWSWRFVRNVEHAIAGGVLERAIPLSYLTHAGTRILFWGKGGSSGADDMAPDTSFYHYLAPTCVDGVKNGGEADVDCGGTCGTTCPTGSSCLDAQDCAENVCEDATCLAGTCDDRVQNQEEADVDCGGPCPPCSPGGACVHDGGCTSSTCVDGTCASPTCADFVANGNETDVDCGGESPCARCADGDRCRVAEDCVFTCVLGTCARPTCNDTVQNGNEVGVDCGGVCLPCPSGHACVRAVDCESAVCNASTCAAPRCDDGVANGGEAGVDCGGSSCAPCPTGSPCTRADDCLGGVCESDTCAAPTCADRVLNGGESDVDCGGPVCTPCLDGARCVAGSDCAAGVCGGARTCEPPTCADGARNGNETDVDCGGRGPCGPCANTQTCASPLDCASRACGPAGACVPASCSDGVANGDEAGVDCGGACGPLCAPGVPCTTAQDCLSRACAAGACAEATCGDAVRNGAEAAVDCGGGECPPCAAGRACEAATDCQSGVCAEGVCAEATCDDQVWNAGEADVDCGAECARQCLAGQRCWGPPDCQSRVCISEVCASPTCFDGVSNGLESGPDCGGTCSACPEGRRCLSGSDCLSLSCVNSTCAAPTCEDRVTNGDEAGVDCGGATCLPCPAGSTCVRAADCTSSVCDRNTCAAPTCEDGVHNGHEAGLDCGGSACSLCPAGAPCVSERWCESRVCGAEGMCTEASCLDGVRNGNESSVDCGGSVCSPCHEGESCRVAADCLSGTCELSACVATCSDGVQNGEEVDVDCSGSCDTPCQEGAACFVSADCASKVCTAGTCASPTCHDGVRNGAEAGVDCGVGCPAQCPDNTACVVPGDCLSSVCVARHCARPSCSDGVANGAEAGVDCGGDTCKGCRDGGACRADEDCLEGTCEEGACAPTRCDDLVRNGDETDVDCGGLNSTCAPCGKARRCARDSDCAGGLRCDAVLRTCAEAVCDNGVRDGEETDVDCGGTCANTCAEGRQCVLHGDCSSRSCPDGLCVAATCTDGRVNGDEDGMDCGGSTCDACQTSTACSSGAQCASNVCLSGVCASPSCVDDIKNGDEQEVDCGGSCDTCAPAGSCSEDSDCVSGTCEIGQCVAYSCTDGQRNGDEEGTDCGGARCPACLVGCTTSASCGGGTCEDGVCVNCADGVRNGGETDVDCGGSCGPCANGRVCAAAADCSSGLCLPTGRCAVPSCFDQVMNGEETAADCGGRTCPACPSGAGCRVAADCAGACVEGSCVAQAMKSGDDGEEVPGEQSSGNIVWIMPVVLCSVATLCTGVAVMVVAVRRRRAASSHAMREPLTPKPVHKKRRQGHGDSSSKNLPFNSSDEDVPLTSVGGQSTWALDSSTGFFPRDLEGDFDDTDVPDSRWFEESTEDLASMRSFTSFANTSLGASFASVPELASTGGLREKVLRRRDASPLPKRTRGSQRSPSPLKG